MATDKGNLAVRARYWVTDRVPTLVALIAFLLFWQSVAMLIDNNRIVAYPTYTWSSLVDNAETVFVRVVETFTSIAVAFVLAVLFGVLLGIVIAELTLVREMSMPMVIFAYAIPHPVLAPVFIIWFITVLDPIVLLEFTGPSAYLMSSVTAADATQQFVINGVTVFAAWVGFFPVFLGTVTGMNSLEERFEHLGTVLGATRVQMVRYFRFWRALPHIASSIKSTVQLSIIGVIVAEFIASSQGIGYQIVLAWKNADLGYMFGVILFIMVAAYLFFQTVVWLLKKVTPPATVE
ncbi:ABC transporter permease [Halococcus agarilyticus]|uniref:ABC transporter permease n=1 Tax=Halococcus agarilyticus TaxID=1232219 RepID=UPI000677ACCA|nr:ABC transporter permease subunit [Halococcus agarilyticus]